MQFASKDQFDRQLGALWGVAVGDALGATLEFMSAEAVASRFGQLREIVGGGFFNWRVGQGTDDTDQTWIVAKAYQSGVFQLSNVADGLVEWASSGPADIGNTTAAALSRLARDQDPRSSGLSSERSCGNGSLMRAIPTAVWRFEDVERLVSESAQISSITHAHKACIDACVAYNLVAAELIKATPVETAIEHARCYGIANGFNGDAQEALNVKSSVAVESLDTSGWVIDSLRCSIWAIQQDDFEETLIGLVNRGNDSDTTGAIAGGLLGARFGATSIPQRWTDKIEYRDVFYASLKGSSD